MVVKMMEKVKWTLSEKKMEYRMQEVIRNRIGSIKIEEVIFKSEDFPISLFEKRNQVYFVKVSLDNEYMKLSLRISIKEEFFMSQENTFECGEFRLVRNDNYFAVYLRINTYDLLQFLTGEPNKKKIQHVTEEMFIIENRIINIEAAQKIFLNRQIGKRKKKMEKYQYSYEQWCVMHPYSGGAFSPR